MLNGELRGDGWRDQNVFDALDLCLACKGCKTDCPVNVDMATYKAEFLSHYYEGRLRPIHAYAFGLIHLWSRLAQISPALVNFVNRAPVTNNLLKKAIGVAPQRKLPEFARESFRSWFARNRGNVCARAQRTLHESIPTPGRIILWPDTFNNFFQP